MALLLVALAAPHAVAAPAGHGSCPRITDEMGDARLGPVDASDTALDVTAVDLDVTPRQMTATVRVVGQPDVVGVGRERVYEVYFRVPEEGTFKVLARLGNGLARWELWFGGPRAGSSGASANAFEYVRNLTGRVGANSVTIIAQRPRDLPLAFDAGVLGRTSVAVGSMGYAFNASADDTEEVHLMYGPRRACIRSRSQ